MNGKERLLKLMEGFSLGAAGLTFYQFAQNIRDNSMKEMLQQQIKQNSLANEQIAKLAENQLITAELKTKLVTEVQRNTTNIQVTLDKIRNLNQINTDSNNLKTLEDIKARSSEIFQSLDAAKNQLTKLSEAVENFISNSNSGSNFFNSNSNFLNEISNIISSYLDWFNSLPLQNQFALVHVLVTFSIFMSLLSLISVYFSEYIFTKLKISEKLKNYPRILRLFELRRKFQTFYFITSTIIILILLFATFFLNLYLLSL